MKISKLFHWLYFIVMMLPIFTIPIFAIYSHRHTIDSYSVQVEETKVVDFNQLVSPLFNVVRDINDITVTFEDNDFYFLSGTSGAVADNYTYKTIQGVSNHVYYLKDSFAQIYNGDSWVDNVNSPTVSTWYKNRFVLSDNYSIVLRVFISANTEYDNLTFYPQIFDLTQMFGSGNEPTIEEFDTWYTSNFYSYTLSRKELLKTGNYITYDDTDIGSQFTYDVYNVVDKYFNYDNVFNFSQLYDYLNMTFFNGDASLGFFIFWHLLIYWLLTSILWLVFDVLMYVPQLVHRWLDKASLS